MAYVSTLEIGINMFSESISFWRGESVEWSKGWCCPFFEFDVDIKQSVRGKFVKF